jgi:hypothetical protein
VTYLLNVLLYIYCKKYFNILFTNKILHQSSINKGPITCRSEVRKINFLEVRSSKLIENPPMRTAVNKKFESHFYLFIFWKENDFYNVIIIKLVFINRKITNMDMSKHQNTTGVITTS